ncbi:hypothetical protein M9H77_27000 [Catharanthus roseus]|uniref:Uncharacterized protein n=1 Tax=Catharanthus roseus TaxID=4058 RepID=A0ACC0ACP8_CATRO|nr:hypothetical protein M9H77_27000 [Catharanthus roseus]
MLANQFRHAIPGLIIAVGIYLVGEFAYNKPLLTLMPHPPPHPTLIEGIRSNFRFFF